MSTVRAGSTQVAPVFPADTHTLFARQGARGRSAESSGPSDSGSLSDVFEQEEADGTSLKWDVEILCGFQ